MKNNKIKTELLEKLKILDGKYPSNKIFSLDDWNEVGFPKKIRFVLDEFDFEVITNDDIDEIAKDDFDELNKTLKSKYGFKLDLNDEGLFYNSDLRSYCGYIDELKPLTVTVFTTKLGISPVGSDMKFVQNLINDCNFIQIIEE